MDHDLVPQEVFVGLYEVLGTTGEEIARVPLDVLLRLNIPMSGLRGRTYDGAANMSGRHSGAQAELKRQQPLALCVHCGIHCLKLITQSACLASPLICDALQWVLELGTLSKQSGKFKASSSSRFRRTVDITQTTVPNQVDSARKSYQSSAVSE